MQKLQPHGPTPVENVMGPFTRRDDVEVVKERPEKTSPEDTSWKGCSVETKRPFQKCLEDLLIADNLFASQITS